MKKLFIMFLILISAPIFGQTRPSWYQLKDKPMRDLREFGAKGDGVTDDTDAWREFLATGGNLMVTSGTYLVGGDAVEINRDTHIYFTNATLKTNGTKVPVIRMTLSTSDISLGIYGANIDCDNTSRGGMDIRCGTNLYDSVIPDRVVIEGCNIKDAYLDNIDYNCAGVLFCGSANSIRVTDTVVTGVSRLSTLVGGTCAGISLSYLSRGNITVSGCTIERVSLPVASPTDADGLKVMFPHSTGAISSGTADIRNNTFVDCGGRCIKIQGNNATISGNTFRYTPASTYGICAIDLQVGGCVVTDNLCSVEDGAVVRPDFTMVAAGNRYAADQLFRISDNLMITDEDVSSFIYPYNAEYHPTEDYFNVIWNIEGNQVLSRNGSTIGRFLDLGWNSADVTDAHGIFNVRNNALDVVASVSFIDLGGPTQTFWYYSHKTASWTLDIQDNSTRYSANLLLGPVSTATAPVVIFRFGPLKIRGNTGFDPSGLDGELHAARILPGSSFHYAGYYETGGLLGLTAGYGADALRDVDIETGDNWIRLTKNVSRATDTIAIGRYDGVATYSWTLLPTP